MTTQQVANKLADLCKKGKWAQAQKELYAKDVWSQEPEGMSPRLVRGTKELQKKGKVWKDNVKVYSMAVSKPTVAGNWITMKMSSDTQWKGAPRRKGEQICLYQVKEGKIVSEQFFYG